MSGLSAGKVTMKVQPDVTGFAAKLKSDVAAEAESGGSFFHEYGKKIGETLLAGFAVLGIGTKVAEYIKNGFEEYSAFDAMNGQFAAGLKSTGNAANLTIAQMDGLATSVAGYSGQTVASIGKTEQILQTFTNIKNVGPNKIFDQATVAAANMAAKLGGDATASAIQLGKALNDPVKGMTALRRVGVAFTTAQTNAVKADVARGDSLAAQTVIMKELNREFGGAAKAAGETFPGSIARAKVAMGELERSAVTPFAKVLPNLIGGVADKIDGLTPVVSAAATHIASSVLPRMAAIGKSIASAFSTNRGNFSQLGAAIKALVTAFFPLISVLGSLQGALPSFAQLLTALVPLLTSILQAVTPIIAGFTQWLAAFTKTSAGATLLKSIVVTLVAAFVAFKVVGTAIKLFEQMGLVIEVAGAALEAFALVQGGAATKAEALALAEKVFAAATAEGGLAAKAAAIGQWLLNAALNANPIAIVVIAVAALVAGLIYFFTQTKLGQEIVKNVIAALGVAFQWIASVATDVWNAVVAAFQAAVSFIQDVIGAVVGFIGQHWQLLIAIFLGPLGLIIDAVVTNFSAIKSFITAIVNDIASFLRTGVAVWQFVIGAVANAIHTLVQAGFNAVKAVVTVVIDAIVIYIRIYVTVWQTIFTTVINAIRAVVTTGFNIIHTIITTVLGAVVSFITGVWNTVNSVTGGALGRFASAVGSGIGNAVGFFTSLPGKVMSAIGSVVSSLTTAGGDMITGLINGIVSNGSKVITAILGVAGGALNAVKNFFGIKSPSRVFHGIGGFLTGGLANGITSTMHHAVNAAKTLAKGVTGAMAIGNIALGGYTATSVGSALAGTGQVVSGLMSGAVQSAQNITPSQTAAAPTIINQFNGQMGYTKDEVVSSITTNQRRALARVLIPRTVA